jgi:hypothetical protein
MASGTTTPSNSGSGGSGPDQDERQAELMAGQEDQATCRPDDDVRRHADVLGVVTRWEAHRPTRHLPGRGARPAPELVL